MKRKAALLFSAFFLLLFVGLSWLGVKSIFRRLRISHMEARFGAAETALHHGQMRISGRGYHSALQAWQQALECGGYYPILGGEYLLAGNCFQQQCQPRVALKCYEEGLRHDPLSISLLTTLGGCAFRLGEHKKAFSVLQKSRTIFPLKKEVLPLWKKLDNEIRGAGRCKK